MLKTVKQCWGWVKEDTNGNTSHAHELRKFNAVWTSGWDGKQQLLLCGPNKEKGQHQNEQAIPKTQEEEFRKSTKAITDPSTNARKDGWHTTKKQAKLSQALASSPLPKGQATEPPLKGKPGSTSEETRGAPPLPPHPHTGQAMTLTSLKSSHWF